MKKAYKIKQNNAQKNNLAKSVNYMNILKSDLNLESRNSVHNYIEEFRNELVDEVNEKFDNFTKESSKKLYTKILEKYTENISKSPNNAELKESMKSKGELKTEVTEKLTAILKDRAIEDFLKKSASEIYQSVVEIFKAKLNAKLDEFINGIEKNKEANKLITFTSFANPMFVISLIGESLLKSKKLGIIIFLIHVLSGLIISFFFKCTKIADNNNILEKNDKKFINILLLSIHESFEVLINLSNPVLLNMFYYILLDIK